MYGVIKFYCICYVKCSRLVLNPYMLELQYFFGSFGFEINQKQDFDK